METLEKSAAKPTDLYLQTNSHLMSSVTSSLADTPGDSGVQCLDSESSELTSQALMSHSLIGAEELACDSQCDQTPSGILDLSKSNNSSIMTRSDLDNQNLCSADDCVPELLGEVNLKSPLYENLPDVVLKAYESENHSITSDTKDCGHFRPNEPKKSLSEDIVYRRRCRKKSLSGQSSQKKRVSFHEDILNNTRTDNIHIEHGFVSYEREGIHCDRFRQKYILTDRFSWCASGDRTPNHAADIAQQTMSDILAYGDSGDKTGIFEYYPKMEDLDSYNKNKHEQSSNNNSNDKPKKLYGCESNSSDSNFSYDSETSSDTSSSNSNNVDRSSVHRNCDKTQKSYSCDGFNSSGHVMFMRKTYFSEADIDQSCDRTNTLETTKEMTQSPGTVKSVLKKKRYITTNVVEEKKENKVLQMLDANNLIDSFKSFYKNFNFNFTPQRGLPEICLDLNNVVEALPCDIEHSKNLSKSLDSGLQIDDDDFVEINLNDNHEIQKNLDSNLMNKSDCKTDLKILNDESPRHRLTLNMKSQADKKVNKTDIFPAVNKYVVNCESTVYEHKGVSYSYVHDSFQTAFETPKEVFIPLPEQTPSKEVSAEENMDQKIESNIRNSTAKRQFNKNITDEIDPKSTTKHLSSPKKQNLNRLTRKSSTVHKPIETILSDNSSVTDNSTIKGDEYSDDFDNTESNHKLLSQKAALLNRYLKSVCQRKDLETKIKRNKFFQNKLKLENFPSIIYPWKEVSDTYAVSAERMSRLIHKEVIENRRLSVRLLTADQPSYFDSFEDNVAIECSEKLRLQIFSYPSETLNRMMRVQSAYNPVDGTWIPLLVFITDYALYIATVKPGGTEYDLLCRLPYNQLDAIVVGPEAQYIQILNLNGNIVYSVVTAEASLGARLASSLEWNARTSPLHITRPPAVLPLNCHQLAVAVARQRHEKKVPEVFFYGHACSGDVGDRVFDAPGAFAPPLEGYLMCRTDSRRPFEPCYFLLRAGVLQWGPHSPDGSTSLPNNIALRTVLGVRRYFDNSRRPHCFEIALSDSRRLLLAAPDDPTASSWLQSLLLHAAQALEEKDGCKRVNPRSGGPPPACTVLVTSHEVFSLREHMDPAFVVGASAYLRERGSQDLLKEYIAQMHDDIEILACGSIKNLTAFKIPDSDENWCCLEWSVCEARERGSGLALVFASSSELERFIATVERAFCALTSELFPLSVVDAAKSACDIAHAKYEAAWAHMLPAQQ